MKKQRIVVGLSGGVDSAVCAHLCQQQGHEVIGVFMQNWETDNDDPFCTAEQDLNDAHQVAQHLDIEFHAVNFAKAYWDQVFQFCLDEFKFYSSFKIICGEKPVNDQKFLFTDGSLLQILGLFFSDFNQSA